MKITENPELRATIFSWLRDTYLKSTKRPEGWHLTEFIYCLTRSYWDRVDPMPPTDSEVLLFASGLGLERVLIPIEYKAEPILCEGIWVSPDFRFDIYGEFKSTRTSSKKIVAFDFPETWIEQIMGYCYALDQLTYDLAVLCLMGKYSPPFPELPTPAHFEFEEEELDKFWFYISEARKPRLELALETAAATPSIPPHPQQHCKDWECGYCRYNIRCRSYCLEHDLPWVERKR